MKRTNDILLVSIDFSKGVDASFMLVARRNPITGATDILAAHTGEEAHEMYDKLLAGSKIKKEENQ